MVGDAPLHMSPRETDLLTDPAFNALRRDIGYVFQRAALLDWRTARRSRPPWDEKDHSGLSGSQVENSIAATVIPWFAG